MNAVNTKSSASTARLEVTTVRVVAPDTPSAVGERQMLPRQTNRTAGSRIAIAEPLQPECVIGEDRLTEVLNERSRDGAEAVVQGVLAALDAPHWREYLDAWRAG